MIYLLEKLQQILRQTGFLNEIEALVVGQAMIENGRKVDIAKSLFREDEFGDILASMTNCEC